MSKWLAALTLILIGVSHSSIYAADEGGAFYSDQELEKFPMLFPSAIPIGSKFSIAEGDPIVIEPNRKCSAPFSDSQTMKCVVCDRRSGRGKGAGKSKTRGHPLVVKAGEFTVLSVKQNDLININFRSTNGKILELSCQVPDKINLPTFVSVLRKPEKGHAITFSVKRFQEAVLPGEGESPSPSPGIREASKDTSTKRKPAAN